MKDIINALMNLGNETVTVHYQCGKIITGRRQFVDVFSNTVIIKSTEDESFHKIDFESINHVILAAEDKVPRVLKNSY